MIISVRETMSMLTQMTKDTMQTAEQDTQYKKPRLYRPESKHN